MKSLSLKKKKDPVFHCENQAAVPAQVGTNVSHVGIHSNHCCVLLFWSNVKLNILSRK